MLHQATISEQPAAVSFAQALLRALALYDEPAKWEAITATGMRQPVGWGPAAAEYQALYEELLASR